jgi:3-deoxy-7-phosphoheptulonate synthase
MQERATDEQVQRVIAKLVEMGFDVHRSTGALRTVLGAVGGTRQFDVALLEVLDGVQEVLRITEPYKLASRTFKPDNTVVTVDEVRIGGDEVIVMAGPCSAETEEQVETTTAAVKRAGAKVLRGGAFKPRSSPYSFQGLGEEGLRLLKAAADRHNLKLVSEVKLHAAAGAGAIAQADHAQARDLRDDRGVAAVGRVHPRRRQHERHALRARHPDVRERDP